MKDRNRTVVVGVDGSGASMAAVAWAAKVASARHLELEIVHGLRSTELRHDDGMAGTDVLFDAVRQDGDRVVAGSRKVAASIDEDLVVTAKTPAESPAPLLVGLSRQARMVVVGASGSGGFTGMLLGTTAATLVDHAHSPVAVIRGRHGTAHVPESGPVVVGVDGSATSELAIAAAFEEASFRGAPLVAVHAWSDVTYEDFYGAVRIMPQWESAREDEERLLAQRLAGWQEKYPDVGIRRVLCRDRPRHALLEAAQTAQLVVAGNRGRGGFAGMLLGSTSQALVQHAACTVLVVRLESRR
ncbi:universal stress protein [Amycolatopsis sp. WQ 127309]|uniref:universal stress protein n=1 Tax=Amycolatopsis sp. WQ 127309 TaxID=2932773 RepID=UPI001FF3C525|nr:universal stress protein [Amycolatopsis sp. WQ 127309]UOZ02999.1 universal stress protein [Amycolatopsis sp. WQ 127309]